MQSSATAAVKIKKQTIGLLSDLAVLVGRREREGQQERRTQDAPAPMAVPILADEQRMGHCSRVTLRKNAHARLGESYGGPIRPQMNEF